MSADDWHYLEAHTPQQKYVHCSYGEGIIRME